MPTDFTDPKRRLKSDLDDLRDEIDQRTKKIREIKNQIEDLEKQKELLEAELEEFYDKEKKIQQKIRRPD